MLSASHQEDPGSNPGKGDNFKGVYQRLGVSLKRWLTPKILLTPEQNLAYFVPLVMEKVVLVSESLFGPANSVRSTHLLVEINKK